MNIFHEKSDNLTGILKIQIDENDYTEKVDKAIRDLQKKAQMPGFRPGKVPIGLVKKTHGKNVLLDQVNKIISESIYNYVKDNNLKILGNPLPIKEQNDLIDWDNQKEFEFHFSLGFHPEIDLALSDKIKVDYFKIKVDNKIIDEQIENLRRNYGSLKHPDESDEGDFLLGELTELNDDESVKENGISNKSTISISEITDEDIKSRFLSRKIGDEAIFDLRKAFNSDNKISYIAGVKQDELPDEGTLFRYKIESVSRTDPAEINEEFFKRVAPEKEINSEKELRELIKEQLSSQYQSEVDRFFMDDVSKKLMEKAKVELPEEFIKQLLLESDRENLTMEKVESEFENYSQSLKWQLIENKIAEDHNLKIAEDEIKEFVRKHVKSQLKQFGQPSDDVNTIELYVNNLLEKKEQYERYSRILFDSKLIDLFKNTLKIKEKEITSDEFINLVTENNKKDSKKTK